MVGDILADGGSEIVAVGGSTFVDVIAGSMLNVSGHDRRRVQRTRCKYRERIRRRCRGSFVRAGSTVNISGVVEGLETNGGSMVRVSGGSLGNGVVADSSSQVELSGGSIGEALTLRIGSHVTFVGGDFRLDGVPIAGLGAVGGGCHQRADQFGIERHIVRRRAASLVAAGRRSAGQRSDHVEGGGARA